VARRHRFGTDDDQLLGAADALRVAAILSEPLTMRDVWKLEIEKSSRGDDARRAHAAWLSRRECCMKLAQSVRQFTLA
jgi:hypothetical protein